MTYSFLKKILATSYATSNSTNGDIFPAEKLAVK